MEANQSGRTTKSGVGESNVEVSLEKLSLDSEDEEVICSVCYDVLLHPIVLPCKHVFCFLCAKGAYQTARTCPMCRGAIPSFLIQNPQVDRSVAASSTTIDRFWCYESNRIHYTWWKFDKRTSEIVEKAYQDFQTDSTKFQCETLIAGKMYVLDFQAKTQKVKFGFGKTRLIKRYDDMNDGLDKILGTAGIKTNNL